VIIFNIKVKMWCLVHCGEYHVLPNEKITVQNKTRKNAIVQYLDYQIPVTQLKGPKGNGDMQAAKRD